MSQTVDGECLTLPLKLGRVRELSGMMLQSTDVQYIHGEREESRSPRPLGAGQGGAPALPAASGFSEPPTGPHLPPDLLCPAPSPSLSGDQNQSPESRLWIRAPRDGLARLDAHPSPRRCTQASRVSRASAGGGLGSCPKQGSAPRGLPWRGGYRWRTEVEVTLSWTPGGPGALEGVRHALCPTGTLQGAGTVAGGSPWGRLGPPSRPREAGPPTTSDDPCLGSRKTRLTGKESSLEGV